MFTRIALFILLIIPARIFCQADSVVVQESSVMDLDDLVVEAMMNNQEIRAAALRMDIMDARVPQASALEDPELRFMQEGMPGFRFNEAMFSRLDLMQTIPFPTKIGARADLAEVQADHAHHDHLEVINDVIANLRSDYAQLWFVQQNIILAGEDARLLSQFSKIAQTKYAVGQASQQEVLKAQLELGMIENDLTSLRQQELSTKAAMAALLNRSPRDTLGYAVIPEEVVFTPALDTLLALAAQNRPMLIHDSLRITEGEDMLRLARQEYLPDFTVGIERMTSPSSGFNGWSVTAGITLPFAPWTLGKAGARVDEASASVKEAEATYDAARNMIFGTIRDLYYKADASKRQLAAFHRAILPQARQALNASLAAYQTGRADYLSVIDAYRTYVDLTKQYFSTRLGFEQTVASLAREVGYQNIATL